MKVESSPAADTQDLEQRLGVEVAGIGVVGQQRLVAIDRLQHEEIGEFSGRAPAGRGHPPGKRFASLMEQPEQLGGERRQPTCRGHVQDRGNERVVEDDLLVCPAFDHVGQGHAGVRVGDLAGQHQSRAQRPHLEQRRIAAGRRRVARLQFADVMPHEFVDRGTAVGFEFARPAQRHGEIQDLIADVGRDVDRPRQRVVVGHAKRRAVGEHPCDTPQRDLADRQQVALELDVGETPAVGDERMAPSLNIALEIALLLLEVLGLQEQALRPDDSVVVRHWRSVAAPGRVAIPERLRVAERTAGWARRASKAGVCPRS